MKRIMCIVIICIIIFSFAAVALASCREMGGNQNTESSSVMEVVRLINDIATDTIGLIKVYNEENDDKVINAVRKFNDLSDSEQQKIYITENLMKAADVQIILRNVVISYNNEVAKIKSNLIRPSSFEQSSCDISVFVSEKTEGTYTVVYKINILYSAANKLGGFASEEAVNYFSFDFKCTTYNNGSIQMDTKAFNGGKTGKISRTEYSDFDFNNSKFTFWESAFPNLTGASTGDN